MRHINGCKMNDIYTRCVKASIDKFGSLIGSSGMRSSGGTYTFLGGPAGMTTWNGLPLSGAPSRSILKLYLPLFLIPGTLILKVPSSWSLTSIWIGSDTSVKKIS